MHPPALFYRSCSEMDKQRPVFMCTQAEGLPVCYGTEVPPPSIPPPPRVDASVPQSAVCAVNSCPTVVNVSHTQFTWCVPPVCHSPVIGVYTHVCHPTAMPVCSTSPPNVTFLVPPPNRTFVRRLAFPADVSVPPPNYVHMEPLAASLRTTNVPPVEKQHDFTVDTLMTQKDSYINNISLPIRKHPLTSRTINLSQQGVRSDINFRLSAVLPEKDAPSLTRKKKSTKSPEHQTTLSPLPNSTRKSKNKVDSGKSVTSEKFDDKNDLPSSKQQTLTSLPEDENKNHLFEADTDAHKCVSKIDYDTFCETHSLSTVSLEEIRRRMSSRKAFTEQPQTSRIPDSQMANVPENSDPDSEVSAGHSTSKTDLVLSSCPSLKPAETTHEDKQKLDGSTQIETGSTRKRGSDTLKVGPFPKRSDKESALLSVKQDRLKVFKLLGTTIFENKQFSTPVADDAPTTTSLTQNKDFDIWREQRTELCCPQQTSEIRCQQLKHKEDVSMEDTMVSPSVKQATTWTIEIKKMLGLVCVNTLHTNEYGRKEQNTELKSQKRSILKKEDLDIQRKEVESDTLKRNQIQNTSTEEQWMTDYPHQYQQQESDRKNPSHEKDVSEQAGAFSAVLLTLNNKRFSSDQLCPDSFRTAQHVKQSCGSVNVDNCLEHTKATKTSGRDTDFCWDLWSQVSDKNSHQKDFPVRPAWPKGNVLDIRHPDISHEPEFWELEHLDNESIPCEKSSCQVAVLECKGSQGQRLSELNLNHGEDHQKATIAIQKATGNLMDHQHCLRQNGVHETGVHTQTLGSTKEATDTGYTRWSAQGSGSTKEATDTGYTRRSAQGSGSTKEATDTGYTRRSAQGSGSTKEATDTGYTRRSPQGPGRLKESRYEFRVPGDPWPENVDLKDLLSKEFPAFPVDTVLDLRKPCISGEEDYWDLDSMQQ